MKTITIFLLLIASAMLSHAQQTNDSKGAILCGLETATVVVSGTTQGSAAGGGGVTSRLKVEDVFLGNDNLKGQVIPVFWLDGKANEPGRRIWFLKPHDQGYQEAVGVKYPFVEATAENIAFLRSELERKQKPNKAPEATR